MNAETNLTPSQVEPRHATHLLRDTDSFRPVESRPARAEHRVASRAAVDDNVARRTEPRVLLDPRGACVEDEIVESLLVRCCCIPMKGSDFQS